VGASDRKHVFTWKELADFKPKGSVDLTDQARVERGSDHESIAGLMQARPLLIKQIAERAESLFAGRELVARTADGIERSSYGEVIARARRLAGALAAAGVRPGDRVATFAWNCMRHLELYFAVPCMGAVLHTLNIRLSQDDLRYIIEHSGDRVIFLDASLADALPQVDGVELEVVMSGESGVRNGARSYEQLLEEGNPAFTFPDLPEDAAAAMCYTSGTTGRPKGVLYSHRSTVLHSLVACQVDTLAIGERDSVMPVVPMFHANAWGIPYAAATCGARLVLPGPRPAAADLVELIAAEGVTKAGAVPTVWQDIAKLSPAPDLSGLREIICGGSAVSESLIATYQGFGVPIVQAWGMTETSPLGSVSRPGVDSAEADQVGLRALQGTPVPLVQARIDPDAGGELQVAGPWIASSYYGEPPSEEKFTADGWLRTGDVAELVDGRYIKLVDRTKDLVKSGGEWISSVELESHIVAHPNVMEAAVIAVPDQRWGERPCACVVVRQGASLDLEGLREFLAKRVAPWWLPDRLELIDQVPRTSVGKHDKKVLRQRYAEAGA
jgi:fatty-acyl-CoA synthase